MAAPIIAKIDAAVAAVRSVWTPAAPDAVRKKYLAHKPLQTLPGRQVWIYPLDYSDEPASRGSQDGEPEINEFSIGATVAERFAKADDPTTAGDPPDDWTEGLINFVHDKVYSPLSNVLPGVLGAVTINAKVTDVYNVAMLSRERVFWSELEFTFRVLE